MLRTATLDSSPYFFTCFASSLRRSSVSWGNTRRIALPSFWGLMPRSEARIAFSIPLRTEASQGWIIRERGSGTEMDATCCIGVGTP